MPDYPGAQPAARVLPDLRSGKEWPTVRVLTCLLVAVLIGVVTAVAGGMVSATVLLGLAACAMTLTNYRIGLWLLVLFMLLSATAIFPREMLGITGANPYNVLLALTLISFLIERVWKRKLAWNAAYPRLWWAYLIPVILAGLAGTLHFSEIPAFVFMQKIVSFSSPVGYLRDVLVKPLTYVLIAVLLGTACKDGMSTRSVIVAMCLAMWLAGAWVFYYVLSTGAGLGQIASAASRDFLSGAGMHANDLGTLAAGMLTLMIFAITEKGNSSAIRWLYAVTGGIAGALLVISFSRGAFLGFAVSLTTFFIMQRRLKIVIAGLIVLAFMLPLLPVELYERLSTGFGTGGSKILYSAEDPLTAGRVAGLWIPLLTEVQAHPYFGNGLQSISWSAPLRGGTMSIATLNPHNLYLKVLLEIGVIGFVLVMLFFLDMWRRFRVAARNAEASGQEAWVFNAAAAALLGYASSGLTGGDYLPDPSNCLLWVVWGLMLAVATANPSAARPLRESPSLLRQASSCRR